MNAQLSQIERRDTGPSFLDRTGDHLYLVQQAEDDLIARLTDAVYRPDYGTLLLNGQRRWVADLLGDATDYPNGPTSTDIMDALIRIARKGDADARALVERLILTCARFNVEVTE